MFSFIKKHYYYRTENQPVFGDLSGDFTITKKVKYSDSISIPIPRSLRKMNFLKIALEDIKYQILTKVLKKKNVRRRVADFDVEIPYVKKYKKQKDIKNTCMCCRRNTQKDIFTDYVIRRTDMLSVDVSVDAYVEENICRACFCKKYNILNKIEELEKIFEDISNPLFYCFVLEKKHYINNNVYFKMCSKAQKEYLKNKYKNIKCDPDALIDRYDAKQKELNSLLRVNDWNN